MSSNTPAHQFEYLGDEQPLSVGNGRRTGLVLAGTAAVVGAAAVGAWAVAAFMSGGPAPATAVPSDAFAYVSLDLDPDGGQKVEALQTLRKFPAIREELGIDTGSDPRRVLYDALTAEEPCPDIDFDDDVDPWLGSKLAVAVVPGDDEPTPFFVVQVKDEGLAEDAMAKVAECADEEAPGTAFSGDFMVVAETGDIADDVVASAEEGSLADDDGFNRWIDEAGGSGIVEAYVSAEAPKYFAEQGGFATATATSELEEVASGGPSLVGPVTAAGSAPPVTEAFEDFEGAALVVRFDDEALELEMAAGGVPGEMLTDGDSGIEELPATTALALGLVVSDTAVQDAIDAFTESSGMTEEQVEQLLAQGEAMTGLELPEDVQALLGDGFSLAVDSSADFDRLIHSSDTPTGMPAGVRIVGEPSEITPALDRLLASVGPAAEGVVVEEGDGVVAVGLDADYVATLAEDGALGDEERFQAALDDVELEAGAMYVDFDAGDWLTELAATDPDERIAENVEPLDSLGLGGSVEDDTVRLVVTLTTD